MNNKQIASRIVELNNMARANGKTYTLMQGMLANDKALCIVAHRQQAKQLSEQYKIDIKRFIPVQDIEKMRGVTLPVVIDFFAIATVFGPLIAEIERLEEGMREAIVVIKKGKQKLREPLLRFDELHYLGHVECVECGHLVSLHNDHCCSYCCIKDCKCTWQWPYKVQSRGEVPKKERGKRK